MVHGKPCAAWCLPIPRLTSRIPDFPLRPAKCSADNAAVLAGSERLAFIDRHVSRMTFTCTDLYQCLQHDPWIDWCRSSRHALKPGAYGAYSQDEAFT